jgi:hypothetical protein
MGIPKGSNRPLRSIGTGYAETELLHFRNQVVLEAGNPAVSELQDQ